MKKLFLILLLGLIWSGSAYSDYEETLICENYEIYVYINDSNKYKSFGRVNGVRYDLGPFNVWGFSLSATDETRNNNKTYISSVYIYKIFNPIQMRYTRTEEVENNKLNIFNFWARCEKK